MPLQADAHSICAGKALQEQKGKGSALAAENSQLKAEMQLLYKQHQEAARKKFDAGRLAAEQLRAMGEHRVQCIAGTGADTCVS